MRNPTNIVSKLYLFFTGFTNSVNSLLKHLLQLYSENWWRLVTSLQMGSLKLVKLPDYATSIIPLTVEKPNSRSFSSNVVSLVSKSLEYFLDSYGIKIPVPSLSKNLPGIIEEYPDGTHSFNEGKYTSSSSLNNTQN